jgi:hypothetical protein
LLHALAARTRESVGGRIEDEVAARERAAVGIEPLPHRNVRRDTGTDEPVKELARSLNCIGRQPIWLQIKAFFGAFDHHLGGRDLVIGARWRRLDIDNHCVLDVDQIVQPVAELDALVRLRRPGRVAIGWRDHLRNRAIRIGIVIVQTLAEFGDCSRLPLRCRPIDLVRRFATIAAGIGFL